MSGKKLIEGLDEAIAVAKGEEPAGGIRWRGHDYVPADRIEALAARVAKLEALRKEAMDVVGFYETRNRDGTGMRGNYASDIEDVERGYTTTAVPGIPWGTRARAFLDRAALGEAS